MLRIEVFPPSNPLHGVHRVSTEDTEELLGGTPKDVEPPFPFFAVLRALCVEVFRFYNPLREGRQVSAKDAKKTFKGENLNLQIFNLLPAGRVLLPAVWRFLEDAWHVRMEGRLHQLQEKKG